MKNALKAKQMQKELAQLGEEGAVQVFRPLMANDYIIGAVGVLQFDVIKTRLKAEYGVDAILQQATVGSARWISSENPERLKEFEKKFQASLALDAAKNLIYLTPSSWVFRRPPRRMAGHYLPRNHGAALSARGKGTKRMILV
ncbi:MAG: hypothetical protein HQK84_12010 [Nitrospinae bacterium]|nr:hypothetical protein [Nitrospinota bacterium]